MQKPIAITLLLLAAMLGLAAPPALADVQVYPWTPRDIASAELTVFPAYLDGLKQENYGASPQTPIVTPVPATSGTTVGTVICPQNGHVLCVPAADGASNVTWQADSSGGRNGFLRFGNGGKSYLQVANSHGALRFLHDARQCYTIAFWIRFNYSGATYGAGTNQTILDSINQAGGAVGFSVYRYTDNKLYFLSCNGSGMAGQYMANFASASTIGASGDTSWHYVVITGEGQGGSVSMYIDGTWNGTSYPSASSTATLGTGVALGTNATNSLQIGSQTNNSNPGSFDLDCLTICSNVISPADAASLYNFNPAANSNSLLRVKSTSAKLLPGDVSHTWSWHDLTAATDSANDQPLLYSSATYPPSASNAVTASGTSVKYVENRLGARFLRYVYLPAAIANGYPLAPVWTSGGANGHPGAVFSGQWNGTSNYSQPYALVLNQPTPPVDKTWYFVLQQNSAGSNGAGAVGSHIHGYSGGTTIYSAIGGVQHTNPDYFVEHLAAGSVANAPAASCYTVVQLRTGAPAGYYYPIANGGTAPVFYCSTTSPPYYIYLPSGSSNWLISPTNGATASALTTAGTPYWQTATANYAIAQTFQPKNGASTNINLYTYTPPSGPASINVYHGQQSGNQTRLGVNGVWGSWVTNTSPPGAMYWDSVGYDYHQLNSGLNGNTSATQHFELNGTLYEMVVILNSLPNHVFYGLMRGVQDKYGLTYMTIGN